VEAVKIVVFASVLFASSFACGQLVCGGTTEHCREAQKKICSAEPVPANLILSVAATVSGTLKDGSEDAFKQVPLSLKSEPADRVILTAKTDENGLFELGHLESGEYRLIMLGSAQSTKPERIGFDQPIRQVCKGSPRCDVLYILNPTPTDQAVSLCPPK
jgi:hypothetical protein